MRLRRFRGDPNVVVLALPRGGVPVAYEVAEELDAPLDVFLVRKLGLPGQEELAIGAVATGGVQVVNQAVVDRLDVPADVIESVALRERRELERQEGRYQRNRSPLEIHDRTVLLVDDGLATGSTMRAAVEALRRLGPRTIVVAVPVGAADTCADVAEIADDVVCGARPDQFTSVGAWYADFSPTSDAEVVSLLDARKPGNSLPAHRRATFMRRISP